jgi:hypothetical protein
MVKRLINDYFENNVLLCRFQSGFRSNHSICSALLKITNDLLMASEAKCVSVMLLLDFSKAFDSIDHDLLCAKLANQYAFSRSAVSFIRSYLSQRMQWVLGQWLFFGIPTGYSERGVGFIAWTLAVFIVQ